MTYNGVQVTVPYQQDDVTIRHVAEHLMRFTLDDGIDILWDGLYFIEFKLSHHFNGEVLLLPDASFKTKNLDNILNII